MQARHCPSKLQAVDLAAFQCRRPLESLSTLLVNVGDGQIALLVLLSVEGPASYTKHE